MRESENIQFVTSAAPGFYVVTPCRDEHGKIFEALRAPVVAWALDGLRTTIPITLQEALSGDDDHAILCPDGEVRTIDESWNCLDDWLRYQQLAMDFVAPPLLPVWPVTDTNTKKG